MQERNYQIPNTRYQIPDKLLAYDPAFDINSFAQLKNTSFLQSKQEAERKQNQLNQRIENNLKTNLAERYNLQISSVVYSLNEDKNLVSADHDEPFLQIIQKGQIYRENLGSGEVEREKAEVLGFERIQNLLDDPNSNTGVIVHISPKGNSNSIYQHNFFDIYERIPSPNGDSPRLVKMTRYTSKQNYQEFYETANKLDPNIPKPINLKDSYFLENPIKTSVDTKELVKMFSPSEETIKQKEFQQLLEACSPLITAYINTICNNQNDPEIYKIYNTILNYADKWVEQSKQGQTLFGENLDMNIDFVIAQMSRQPVRTVKTGCGIQSGFLLTNNQLPATNFPFSVSEFANLGKNEDEYGTLEIHCEECGTRYDRSPGKLEEKCRHCGGKKGVVC